MKILFTHPNFPAQFRHVAEAFGSDPANQVIFLTKNPRPEWKIPGVKKALYKLPDTKTDGSCSGLIGGMLQHAEAALDTCKKLKKKGFIPDLCVGHSGWGQGMFLRDVFPDTPFLGYFEWFYAADSPEITFDSPRKMDDDAAKLRVKNTAIMHDLVSCAGGITPTAWQKSQFPEEFHAKLVQLHDGINTDYFAPDPGLKLEIEGVDLSGASEILTYSARGFEPYRGFPQFYRALPKVLRDRPGCHVVIVGEDRVCYGSKLANGTYKELLTKEVKLDESRVHFTGPLPYGQYKQVLQASTVHTYLSWPFVLSWSCLEAMSCGCLMVGSDTAPVSEVIKHGINGLLTDFRSHDAIAESIIDALSRADTLADIRANARNTVLAKYDLKKLLPMHMKIMQQTAEAGPKAKIALKIQK